MMQGDNQGKEICLNDQATGSIPETTLEGVSFANGMTAVVNKMLNRLDVEGMEEGSGDEGIASMCSTETIQYLETLSVEIGGFIVSADQLAGQTRLLAKKTTVQTKKDLTNRSNVLALAEHIRNLSEISDRSARSIYDVVYGIQQQVHQVVSDIKKADKASIVEAGNIKAMVSTLKNIIPGMVYIVKEFRSIKVNAKDVLTEAKACFVMPR